MRNHRSGLAILAAIGTVACGSPFAPKLAGQWGGGEVSLILTDAGGELTYQCGTGRINEGWSVTEDGQLAGEGVHFFGGGPQPSTGRPPHPALYEGQVDPGSEVLTLTVTVVDQSLTLGPYTLVRNGPQVSEICF